MIAKGLGRGFESLIPTELIDEEFDPTADDDATLSKLTTVKIEKVIRDEAQPRKHFDESALEMLANSIKEHGILQPLVVVKDGLKYKIVAGERRWRAAKIAGLSEVPVIVRTIDAQNRLELSIIENAQREDLNAIELATAYAKLKSQFNLTPKEIAARVSKSESSVINTMRLLNLPESAKKAMVEHKLPEGVMRPLITADPELIEKALPQIIEEGWTARKVEQYVSANKKQSSAKALKTSIFSKQESSLSEKYSTKVKITSHSITFSCKNESELKTLLEKF